MNYKTRSQIARLASLFKRNVVTAPASVKEILSDTASLGVVNQFNKLYYESGVAGSLSWRGVPLIKNPCDLWMMLELLQRIKPAVLIETGTHHGGSALFFAEMTRLLSTPCAIVTVDINPKWHVSPEQYGIHSIVGYSTDDTVRLKVEGVVNLVLKENPGPVMVTLDSDHSEENVSRELELYAPFVTTGSYLIIEDTNVNGHPVGANHGPGPWEAVQKFLMLHGEFQQDRECEKHLLTFFPGGWLRKNSNN
jgi:cephalosporin hydroxylase